MFRRQAERKLIKARDFASRAVRSFYMPQSLIDEIKLNNTLNFRRALRDASFGMATLVVLSPISESIFSMASTGYLSSLLGQASLYAQYAIAPAILLFLLSRMTSLSAVTLTNLIHCYCYFVLSMTLTLALYAIGAVSAMRFTYGPISQWTMVLARRLNEEPDCVNSHSVPSGMWWELS